MFVIISFALIPDILTLCQAALAENWLPIGTFFVESTYNLAVIIKLFAAVEY